jgi:putative ATP-binding cassette transporter
MMDPAPGPGDVAVQQPIRVEISWTRFGRILKGLALPELKGEPIGLLLLLFAFLVGINGLNVLNSYVGRDFMTAIERRGMEDFIYLAGLYVGVLALSTLAAVLYRFTEERLGLLWRARLTRRLVRAYLDHRTYHRLKAEGGLSNPDERIGEDLRSFSTTTLSFLLMLTNGLMTVVAFSGVLWSIDPRLFLVAGLYAALGTGLSILLGRPLVGLDSGQLDREASLRADLIYVRENAEPIALARREGRLRQRIGARIDAVVENQKRIIAVNRRLGFFTTGYNNLIAIIPALVVAPMFIRGEAEFGVIAQASMAFAHLVAAFSLIVTQFQSIASFAAVVSRVDTLWQAVEPDPPRRGGGIEIVERPGHLVYERVSLSAPEGGDRLLRDLSLTIAAGTRVLIRGPNRAAKLALFRATAGIWDEGEGRILRPSFEQVRFLPERPYLYPGTLRELLVRTGSEATVPDARIVRALESLGLEAVLERAGGLDREQDWETLLSLGEEQLLAFVRLMLAGPQFAFLDRVCTALGPAQTDQVLGRLWDCSITYLSIGGGDENLDLFDCVLDIEPDGSWTYRPVEVTRTAEPEPDPAPWPVLG